MIVDLDMLIADASGIDVRDLETPEQILRQIKAKDLETWEGSPAYELVLVDRKQAIAYVQSDGRANESTWYPVEGVSTDSVRATQARLERAGSLYLQLPDGATELILAALADGARNGLLACQTAARLAPSLTEDVEIS